MKWFNPERGYGFIAPNGGGRDVFVHISALERSGIEGLTEGQTVVASGQFLIDSEASLTGVLARLAGSDSEKKTSAAANVEPESAPSRWDASRLES